MATRSREEEIALYESERNKAMDDYFGARPQLERTAANERIFEGGFRIAWKLRLDSNSIALNNLYIIDYK